MAELAIDRPPPDEMTAAAPLSRSQRYINRELSWLAFNERVLEEASNSAHPLLERVRFLSISDSNLDEFYMVRVAALKELAASGVPVKSDDGLTPDQQLAAIGEVALGLVRRQQRCWADLQKRLRAKGISILDHEIAQRLRGARREGQADDLTAPPPLQRRFEHHDEVLSLLLDFDVAVAQSSK